MMQCKSGTRHTGSPVGIRVHPAFSLAFFLLRFSTHIISLCTTVHKEGRRADAAGVHGRCESTAMVPGGAGGRGGALPARCGGPAAASSRRSPFESRRLGPTSRARARAAPSKSTAATFLCRHRRRCWRRKIVAVDLPVHVGNINSSGTRTRTRTHVQCTRPMNTSRTHVHGPYWYSSTSPSKGHFP